MNAATPGLLICLGIGGIVYVVAPIMLLVSLGLTRRVRAGTKQVRAGFAIAVSFVAAMSIIQGLSSLDSFSEWWRFTGIASLLACWVMVIVTLVQVDKGLRRGPAPPPTSRPWG